MTTTARTTWTLPAAELARVQFTTPPANRGQIVEVSYGLWPDGCGGGLCVRCTRDSGDDTADFAAAELADGEEVEPQNGEPSVAADYLPLTVTRR